MATRIAPQPASGESLEERPRAGQPREGLVKGGCVNHAGFHSTPHRLISV